MTYERENTDNKNIRGFVLTGEGNVLNSLERKFLEQIRLRRLVEKNEHVLIALSGGPDSMALLHLFLAVLPALQCRISAAHCNFRLRGEESERDEEFVRKTCSELGVDCYVGHFPTLDTSRVWKKSIEETARIQRYQFFDAIIREHGLSRLATGHHVNDNAETMLFNLFRGVSMPSLKGIRAKHGMIIRPLLLFHKSDILEYLEQKGIGYRTDTSNLGIVHDRNFIRHRVIPLIEERFSGKLMPSLQRLSEHAAELEEFLELYFENLFAEHPSLAPGSGCFDVDEILRLTAFERKEILKRALWEYDASIDGKVLQRLDDLLKRQSGRSVPVSGALHAVRTGKCLCFEERSVRKGKADPSGGS